MYAESGKKRFAFFSNPIAVTAHQSILSEKKVGGGEAEEEPDNVLHHNGTSEVSFDVA
jgi:hypothetical protein